MAFLKTIMTTALALGLTACTLPDIKPFAEATSDLSTTVASINQSLSSSMVAAQIPDAQRQKFDEAMKWRISALKAMERYSTSLISVADAGAMGAKNVGKVADSLGVFMTALSGPQIPATISDVVKNAYGVIANVRSANALSDAFARADPTIQAIATLLIKDNDNFKDIALATTRTRENLIRADHRKSDDLDIAQTVQDSLRELEKSAATDVDRDPSKFPEETATQIQRYTALLDGMKGRLEAIESEKAKIKEDEAAMLRLINIMSVGVDKWASIHGTLAESMKNGAPLNIQGLTTAISMIKDQIKEVKAP